MHLSGLSAEIIEKHIVHFPVYRQRFIGIAAAFVVRMEIEVGQRVHESSTGALHALYAFPRDDAVVHDATHAIG